MSFVGDAAPIATAAIAASDIRLKENLNRVGTKNGFNIYEFNYIGNPQRYRGVIAQEVEKIIPQAVLDIAGTKYVNYSMLGIPFREV